MKQLNIDFPALIFAGLIFLSASCSPTSTANEPAKGKAVFTSSSISGKNCANNYSFEDAFYAALGQEPPGETQIAQYVRRIFQDKKGHLWFGTNQFGVCRFDGQQLQYFSTAEGLGGSQVTGIIEDQKGQLWLTTNGGVSVYDGETFTNYTKKDGLPSNWAWSILEDRRGQIWVGTLEGLCRYEGGRFVPVGLPTSDAPAPSGTLDPDRIMCIVEDAAGDLWFGTDGRGMYHYDGTTFINYTRADGLAGNTISSIVPDEKGGLWLGTMFNGVSYYADGKTELHFKASDTIGNNEAWKVYKDHQGEIWFSSEGYGLYRYDGIRLRNYNELDGLGVPAVQEVFEDRMGRVWVGGGGGLYRLDGTGFTNVKKGGPWDNC
jgi:ligand-binding sensor domain-containing protein